MSIVINFELIREDNNSSYPFISSESYSCSLESYPNVVNYINTSIKIENCLFVFIKDENFDDIKSLYSEKIYKKTYFDPFFIGIKKNCNYKEEGINCAWFIYLDSLGNDKSFLSIEFYNSAKNYIEKLNNYLFKDNTKNIINKIIKELESLDYSSKVSYSPPLKVSDLITYHIEAEKTIIQWLKSKNKTYSILDKFLPVRFYIE
jgi:hypothetical protein